MQDILFFDGKCPLCSREMAILSKHKNTSLRLQDIHQLDDKQMAVLPSKPEMLKLLHLQKGGGEWLIGLDANVAAWGHTKFGLFFKPLRWPLIGWVADKIYLSWAERRFCRLDY